MNGLSTAKMGYLEKVLHGQTTVGDDAEKPLQGYVAAVIFEQVDQRLCM